MSVIHLHPADRSGRGASPQRVGALVLAGALALTAVPATSATAAAPPGGTLSLVSVSSDGRQVDGETWMQQQAPSVSADGSVAVFTSRATTLVPGDTNRADDVFAHDRRTATTVRVSVSSTGEQADDGSSDPAISADGRFVVFTSAATNLVRGDTNGALDVFLHDLRTGVTSRVSVGLLRRQGDGPSYTPVISADGSTVAFQSQATNLATGRGRHDTNGTEDVYVRDLRRGRTTRASLAPDGQQFTGPSAQPALSADGRTVAFVAEFGGDNQFEVWSFDRRSGRTQLVSVREGSGSGQGTSVGRPSLSADGRYVAFDTERALVPEDTGAFRDVYVRDTVTGRFTRISHASGGGEADADSKAPTLSADGRRVAFASAAENLVPGDTNGFTDVFLTDTSTGTTSLVSRGTGGAPADFHSAYYGEVAVSGDGKHVVFQSVAENLVPGDVNLLPDVFVWDAPRRS